jgi:hypothetical protein
MNLLCSNLVYRIPSLDYVNHHRILLVPPPQAAFGLFVSVWIPGTVCEDNMVGAVQRNHSTRSRNRSYEYAGLSTLEVFD